MSAKKAACNANAASAANRARGKNAIITITNGCFAGLEIALQKKKMTLGRAIECDICLDHTDVSSRHAVITRDGAKYVLEDLGGSHGTLLNKKKIHRVLLHNGDLISIGSFQLKFSS
jgi:pSer/pThr/pTyr-binding forkhead associated (FHA) protein